MWECFRCGAGTPQACSCAERVTYANAIPAWHETHANVLELAHHLTRTEVLKSAMDVVRFIEEPWKWGSEWLAYLDWRAESVLAAQEEIA